MLLATRISHLSNFFKAIHVNIDTFEELSKPLVEVPSTEADISMSYTCA